MHLKMATDEQIEYCETVLKNISTGDLVNSITLASKLAGWQAKIFEMQKKAKELNDVLTSQEVKERAIANKEFEKERRAKLEILNTVQTGLSMADSQFHFDLFVVTQPFPISADDFISPPLATTEKRALTKNEILQWRNNLEYWCKEIIEGREEFNAVNKNRILNLLKALEKVTNEEVLRKAGKALKKNNLHTDLIRLENFVDQLDLWWKGFSKKINKMELLPEEYVVLQSLTSENQSQKGSIGQILERFEQDLDFIETQITAGKYDNWHQAIRAKYTIFNSAPYQLRVICDGDCYNLIRSVQHDPAFVGTSNVLHEKLIHYAEKIISNQRLNPNSVRAYWGLFLKAFYEFYKKVIDLQDAVSLFFKNRSGIALPHQPLVVVSARELLQYYKRFRDLADMLLPYTYVREY